MRQARLRGFLPGLLATALALGLAACEGDPKDVGLTGPFPEGVAPVTLIHPQARHEAADDTPGVRADIGTPYGSALNRLAATKSGTGNSSGSANPATPTRRYYGYKH